MKNTRISQILNRLMSEKKIRVAELARQINLPQPTVHRIANGACEHPHISSLKPIADYFAVSVDQLKGLDSIPWLDKVLKVPLLSWGQVLNWPGNKEETKDCEFILTDANVGALAYALKVEDASMDPAFPKGTILIADPEKSPKDRSYVIAKLAKHPEPIFRQLLIDAQDHYLKPLSPALEIYKLTHIRNNDSMLSVVVQAKRNCED